MPELTETRLGELYRAALARRAGMAEVREAHLDILAEASALLRFVPWMMRDDEREAARVAIGTAAALGAKVGQELRPSLEDEWERRAEAWRRGQASR